jgi:Fur family transcriptional regulator, ferric uptake regulator
VKATTSRNTIARTRILALLGQAEMALSHHQVQEQLNGLCNRVTIYRVLDRLEEEGLIHKTSGLNGEAKYAACQRCDHQEGKHQHHHLHFNCTVCQKTYCLETTVPQITLPQGYSLDNLNLVATGTCPTCR